MFFRNVNTVHYHTAPNTQKRGQREILSHCESLNSAARKIF
jgi:hypothetical protein